MKLNRQQPYAAFTLLEIILAVGAASLVLAVISSAFFSALRLRDATSNAVDAAVPLDRALALLRQDLRCAVTPKASGVLSGDFKAGNITSTSVNVPVSAEFCTATGALSQNEPWGDIQRVAYGLKDSAGRAMPGRELYRSVTRNLLTIATPDVADQFLMGGVESLQFSCYDGSQWFETWDTSDTMSANTNLPVAVRVRILRTKDKDKSPIELLVPIDSQTRTNMTTGS